MRRDSAPFVLVVLLLAADVALALLVSGGRGALAALVLLAPGYLLAAVALPPGAFAFPERLAGALGFSLSSVGLLGLALNLLPWGLQPTAWLASLAALSLVLAGVLLVQDRPRGRWRPSRHFGGRRQVCASLACILAGAVTVAVLVGNHADATVQREGGFTQLWLLPDASGAASLGVTSEEDATLRYDLAVVVGSRTLRQWHGLALRPGNTWRATLTAANLRGVQGRIEAQLYREDRPGVIYRYVSLWMGNGQGQGAPTVGAGASRAPGGVQLPPHVPPSLHVTVQPAAVPVGGSVRLAISAVPAIMIRYTVAYPGLAATSFVGRTDGHGRLTVALPVPDALPAGEDLRLTVRALLQGGPVQVVRKVRLLPPARIPLAAALSVELPAAGLQPGQPAPLLVHYSPRVLVQVKVSFPGAPPIDLSGQTNGSGDLPLTIAVPAHAAGSGGLGAAVVFVRALDVGGPVEVTRTVPIAQGLGGS